MRVRKYWSVSVCLSVLLLLCSVIFLCICFYRNKHIPVLAETKSMNPFAKVLFITSSENSFSATLEEKGIRSYFSKKNINVDVERYAKDYYNEIQVDNFFLGRMKYLEEKNRYNAVIVSGENACRLVQKRYSRVWSDIPVFYFQCGSNYTAKKLYGEKNYFSFQETMFIDDTVDVARKLFPMATTFFAIYDKTDAGYENWKAFCDAAPKYPDVKFHGHNTSFYTREESAKVLRELNEDTVIFYIGASSDSSMNIYSIDEQTSFILNNTHHPVFSRNSDGLGHGMIGGNMLNYESAGEQVAAVVARVLLGEDIKSIPMGKLEKGKFCFDYNAAKRFGIKSNRLPYNSTIINFNTNRFYRTTGFLLGIFGLVFSLVDIIIILCFMAVSEKKKTRELRNSYEKMEYMVGHDFLTKLPNRIKAKETFDKMIVSKKSFSVILLDVDNFKAINDNYSHACGDEVLRTVATRMFPLMTSGSFFAARFGGDEFMVIYTDGILEEEGDDYYRLKKVFEDPVCYDGKKIQVNASFGVVNSDATFRTMDDMLSDADLALYEAKKKGKNKIVYFCENMKENLKNVNYISKQLEDAIENDGINVVYQPQIDAESGKIHGYEALMRLRNMKISPAEFIPVAEETGLISKIDRILTEKVVRQLAEWRRHGIPLYRVSINYSYGQISDKKYVDFLDGLLNQYGIDPSLIGIEITESLFASDKDQILTLLHSFKEKGIALALDDFGTGYSSLSYLTFLPVNVVKIDKSIVDNYLGGERDKFIKNIVRLVHSLEMKLTVEGVEHEWQNEKLKNFHCDYIQGYYYSKPISGMEVEEWVSRRSA